MGRLFEISKAVALNDAEAIKKAATSFEVGASLTPRNAVNRFNTITKNADIFSKIRLVELYENTAKLSDVITKGVLTDRAGAGTAKTALNAGNDISGITKDNIGNSVTAKEMYYLFNLNFDELANMARTELDGAGNFENLISNQFSANVDDTFEALLFLGDNTSDQPYGFEVNAKANLVVDMSTVSTTDNIKKVRHVNTANLEQQYDRLKALRDVIRLGVRRKGTYFMNTADADKYGDEMKSSSSHTGDGRITFGNETFWRFDGQEILVSPYISEGTIMFSPLDNMCKCINVKKMVEASEMMRIPVNMIYSLAMFWNQQFITFNDVAIAYDQS